MYANVRYFVLLTDKINKLFGSIIVERCRRVQSKPRKLEGSLWTKHFVCCPMHKPVVSIQVVCKQFVLHVKIKFRSLSVIIVSMKFVLCSTFYSGGTYYALAYYANMKSNLGDLECYTIKEDWQRAFLFDFSIVGEYLAMKVSYS